MAEMKDSGTTWLGMIPKDWELSKISSIYELRTQKVSDKDYPPLSVTMNGIVPQLDSAAKTNAHDDRKLVKKGDFAINSRSDRRGSCGVSEYDGSVSLINTVMKPRDEMNPDYYNWLFHTVQFADEFYKWGHGIVNDLWTTNWQDMKHIDIPVPTLPEQKIIADYLNKIVPEIDSLHADIEKQIETLEEYKKSIITEAVTKGLDPDVEMKDSGVEWIGKIPIKWNTTRIGYESWIRARLGWKGLKADEYVDEGNPFLSAFNIIDNQINWKSLNYITDERYEESPEIMLKIGDIVLVKDGAGIGKCARIDDLPFKTATTNGSLAVISTKENLDYDYLYFYLQSAIFQNFIIRMMNGMGVPHLSQEELRKIVIPFPPKNEQRQIAVYLEQKRTEIDISISDKKQQLETLEQYKKSLIYEYVTGKKEVK